VGSPAGCLFTNSGLVNGTTYYYKVAAVNETGAGAWAVSEKKSTPSVNSVLAPTHIVVTPGNTQATVTWDPVIGLQAFRVEVAEYPGGPDVSASHHPSNILSTTITGLTNGRTYYFRVYNWGFPACAYSAEVSATPSVTLPLAPTSPSAKQGNTQVSLTWNAVDGATGYRVYRRTPSSQWSSGPIGSPAGCLFTDSGLVNGTTYYYNVAAVNETGAGAWAVSEKKGTPSVNSVLAPTHIVAIPGNTQATVTWDPVIGLQSFRVEVAEYPGGPDVSSSHSSSTLSRTITGLTNGRTYYFRVYNWGNPTCAYSDEVSTTPSVTLPFAPTSLNNPAVGNTQVSLTWNAVDGASGYKVYRRTQPGSWSTSSVGSAAGTLFTDVGIVNGTVYQHNVAAVNAAGAGAWAIYGTSSTPTEIPPIAPNNVQIFPGDTQATITWDPVADAARYKITQATSLNGPYQMYYYTSSSLYLVTGLTNGQTYYFWVQAENGAWSAYSTPVSTAPQWPADTGNISGRISASVAGYDSLGVRNAVVSLDGTGFSTSTDSDGNFTLVNVPFGDYQLVVSAAGMDNLTQNVSFNEQNMQVAVPQIEMSCLDCICIHGDANGDDHVGIGDAIYILQTTSGLR
jgi:fibronectin type 3 domain-containing protein